MVDLLLSNEAKRSEVWEVWEGKTGVSLKVGSYPSVFVRVIGEGDTILIREQCWGHSELSHTGTGGVNVRVPYSLPYIGFTELVLTDAQAQMYTSTQVWNR